MFRVVRKSCKENVQEHGREIKNWAYVYMCIYIYIYIYMRAEFLGEP